MNMNVVKIMSDKKISEKITIQRIVFIYDIFFWAREQEGKARKGNW